MPKENVDVEILASWMCTAALEIDDGFTFLRFLVRLAASNAKYIYGKFDEDETEEQLNDPLDVRAIITRFAAALDEELRDHKQEEK